MGIVPTRALIEAYVKSRQAEDVEQAVLASPIPPADQPTGMSQTRAGPQNPRGYSKSLLEPILREQGTVEGSAGRRQAGRPRIIASWFLAVAQTMADGTSLRTALAIHQLNLSRSEIRACYRNTTLRALYQEARRRYFIENRGRGMKRASLKAVLRELGHLVGR